MAVKNLSNYTDKDGLGFPLNFRRGNPNPLDNSSLWGTLAGAQAYAQTDPTAYVGQVLTVLDDTANTATVYVIEKEDGTLKQVGTVTLVDNTTIIKDTDNVISIKGYADAAEGAQLVKTADGLTWIVPDTTTVEGLSTAVQAIQDTLGDSTKGLVKKVNDNSDAIAANTTKINKNAEDIGKNAAAITKLNGSSTTAGSVAYTVAQEVAKIVGNAPEDFDTLKEIADWISEHGDDAAAMNSAIQQNKTDIAANKSAIETNTASIGTNTTNIATNTKNIKTNTDAIDALEALVGDTAVATQIANAINAALKSGETDKYALASELTKLSGTVSAHVADTTIHVTAEDRTKWNAAQANVLEGVTSSSLKVGTITNKKVAIDIEWGTF